MAHGARRVAEETVKDTVSEINMVEVLPAVAVALLGFLSSCDTGSHARESRQCVQYRDLPASLRAVLGMGEADVILLDGAPHESTWNPLDEDGQERLHDGLPVSESCLVQHWSFSRGENRWYGGMFVLGGPEQDRYIKGVVLPTLPFANWRTVWAGSASLLTSQRSRPR